MYTYSVCYNEKMKHGGSCQCCLKCPNCSTYIILHYITIIAIIFSIICIIPKEKVAFWVGIHCRLQANHITHHRGIQTTYAAYSLHSNRYNVPARCMQGQHRLPEAPAAGPWPVLPPAGGACAHAHAVGGGSYSRAGPTRTSAEAATALAREGWPPLPAVCVWGGVCGGRVCVRAY